MSKYIVMEGVQEYAENRPVELISGKDYKEQQHKNYYDDMDAEDKAIIDSIQPNDQIMCATNEGGFNGTWVNLTQVLRWLKENS
jgi:hypothetical protein